MTSFIHLPGPHDWPDAADGRRTWQVLDCFDTIVVNAGNTFRLQEECGSVRIGEEQHGLDRSDKKGFHMRTGPVLQKMGVEMCG